jgi:hypothetical protein
MRTEQYIANFSKLFRHIFLWQHRAIRQEVSDRIFTPIQSLENEGILYVFLVFQTEEVGQKDGGDSQTQLCGVALYMIPAKNKVDIFYLSVQLYGIDLCSQFMW